MTIDSLNSVCRCMAIFIEKTIPSYKHVFIYEIYMFQVFILCWYHIWVHDCLSFSFLILKYIVKKFWHFQIFKFWCSFVRWCPCMYSVYFFRCTISCTAYMLLSEEWIYITDGVDSKYAFLKRFRTSMIIIK